MRGAWSQAPVRLLGGLAALVVAVGVAGSVLTLGTSIGIPEILVLLVAGGGLGLTAGLGLRRVPSTQTAYW